MNSADVLSGKYQIRFRQPLFGNGQSVMTWWISDRFKHFTFLRRPIVYDGSMVSRWEWKWASKKSNDHIAAHTPTVIPYISHIRANWLGVVKQMNASEAKPNCWKATRVTSSHINLYLVPLTLIRVLLLRSPSHKMAYVCNTQSLIQPFLGFGFVNWAFCMHPVMQECIWRHADNIALTMRCGALVRAYAAMLPDVHTGRKLIILLRFC